MSLKRTRTKHCHSVASLQGSHTVQCVVGDWIVWPEKTRFILQLHAGIRKANYEGELKSSSQSNADCGREKSEPDTVVVCTEDENNASNPNKLKEALLSSFFTLDQATQTDLGPLPAPLPTASALGWLHLPAATSSTLANFHQFPSSLFIPFCNFTGGVK